MTAVADGVPPQSHWGYGERPIVIDDAPEFPLVPPTPTEEMLQDISLQECYRRSCATLGIKPNSAIAIQLPNTTEGRPQWALHILDGTGAYLGSKGVVALIPIILACPRLTHVLLPRVGMQVGAAKALITALATHSGITTIQLHQNHLGTCVGQLLLKLVQQHRRIHTLGLDETLIIPQLKRRIDAQLARNLELKDTFSLPLIPHTADDYDRMVAEKVREAEERARLLRAEALRKEVEDRLPTWAVAVISELRVALVRHRRNMPNVFALFKPHHTTTSSSSSAPNHHSSIPCTIDNFQRGLKILGVTAPQLIEKGSTTAVQQCRDFAELFGAYNRHDDVIRVGDLIAALRVHAAVVVATTVAAPPTPATRWVPLREAVPLRDCCDDAVVTSTSSVQRTLDALYDARANVAAALEAMDRDQMFTARISEVANGLASLTGDAHAVRAILLHYLTHTSSNLSTENAEQYAAAIVVQATDAPYHVNTDSGTRSNIILVKDDLDMHPMRYHLLLDALGLEFVSSTATSELEEATLVDDPVALLDSEQRRFVKGTRSELRQHCPLL